MSELLEIRVVVESIQNAFRPLRCGIEFFDFERKLRFRVFDVHGRPVLNMSKMLTRRARDPPAYGCGRSALPWNLKGSSLSRGRHPVSHEFQLVGRRRWRQCF